ncbi:hypothetical protein PsorP6_002579 [Peronosclerospora sorghi]|uniref:Uncharacterized protein n=1 Tax=Peronosclerospora sorghi TaxID=230839 RepID=A0ACC0WR53_9STRA|nr:hypothetical protein PsorP6_002579 [Peronosclerospora sorghi]
MMKLEIRPGTVLMLAVMELEHHALSDMTIMGLITRNVGSSSFGRAGISRRNATTSEGCGIRLALPRTRNTELKLKLSKLEKRHEIVFALIYGYFNGLALQI